MLSAIKAPSIDALFSDIPKKALLKGALRLPSPLSEPELKKELRSLSEKNTANGHRVSFLGGGSYNHFIPSVVRHLAGRSEFYTSYTPYQAELSQGMLQAIYEYQTMICNLTGMDVANASMYDGATAAAEAASLACRHTGRRNVYVSEALHPEYRTVIKTYGRFAGWNIEEVSPDSSMKDPACFIFAQPDFFGRIEENAATFSDVVHSKGGLSIATVDPISLGLLAPPGDYGADVVVGEGAALGGAPSFGGPGLGLFACKKAFLRLMPGRLSGATVDDKGRRGFVMTLQTREQHIRRDRATSNICTNEALNALTATIYLSALGKAGLKKVAELCLQKANYAKELIKKLPGFSLPHSAPAFKEFVVSMPFSAKKANEALLGKGIVGGLDLSLFYPERKNQMLLCVTELIAKADIDRLVKALGEVK